MASRVTGRYDEVGSDFCQQPAAFENPAFHSLKWPICNSSALYQNILKQTDEES